MQGFSGGDLKMGNCGIRWIIYDSAGIILNRMHLSRTVLFVQGCPLLVCKKFIKVWNMLWLLANGSTNTELWCCFECVLAFVVSSFYCLGWPSILLYLLIMCKELKCVFTQWGREYSAKNFIPFFLPVSPGYYFSLSYLSIFPSEISFCLWVCLLQFLSWLRGGNDDIEGFSCYYVG